MAQERCPSCGGSGIFGSYADNKKCQRCYGRGTITVPDKPSSGPQNGCFPSGTMVITPSGVRDIADLNEGDLVLARVEGTTTGWRARRILKKVTYASYGIWMLEFHDGSFVRTTASHSFLVNGKWIRASKISAGDLVATRDTGGIFGQKVATRFISTNETEDVHNLIIEGEFNFVADGVLANSFTYFKLARRLAWSLYGTCISTLSREVVAKAIQRFSPRGSLT